jgi:membrane-bound lytic murein transglycosylase A
MIKTLLSVTGIVAFSVSSIVYARSIAYQKIQDVLVRLNAQEIPDFIDDGHLQGLRQALQNSLDYYQTLPSNTPFLFGNDLYQAKDLIQSLKILNEFLESKPTPEQFNRFIKKHFLVYRSNGVEGKDKITFSAYYVPTLEASLVQDPIYRYPLYARPPELVDVYLEKFDPKKRGERIVGQVQGPELIPYFTRAQIDSEGLLRGRALEIAWAKNPVDIFLLQIQGSGRIETPEGIPYHIRYAGDNGLPYHSLGQYLIENDRIPKAEFNRERMVAYLNSQSEEKRQEILNTNPRYIFFDIGPITNPILGSLLVPLTAERSIASDPKFYPPGALAWISTQQPQWDADGNRVGTEPLSRFVMNQDEGGAIKGTGRIDFFAGQGIKAQKKAETLWYTGELYFFIKKP